MQVNEQILKELRRVELEILDVFHSFCVDHNIHYSLGFGTLLGAIRHQGFIPWDDDIDIIMPRFEYNRFIKLWQQKPVDGYVLQNEYEEYSDNGDNFCKLRKDNTTFIESENDKFKRRHKGIFIDIFPVDRVASDGAHRKCQFLYSIIYMLYCRNHPDRQSGFVSIGQEMLLHLPDRLKTVIKKKALSYMTQWNNDKKLYLVVPCTVKFCKKYYPADLFDEYVLTDFNGRQYYRTKNFQGFLESMYGDYMTLPPVEERTWKHHPILIDFENTYEKLVEKGLAK